MANIPVRILEIVEDEEQLLAVLSSQFDPGQIKVITARDGEEGLALALREHPDFILLDLLMPKMDGLTMLKNLRADAWGKTVPVIILTVSKEAANVATALQLGAFEYVVKSDHSLEEIVNRVKEKILAQKE